MQRIDIVFPKGNEKELVAEALKMGFSEVILCYTNDSALPKNALPHSKTARVLTERKSIPKYRKLFDLLFGPPERAFFEDKRIDGIVGVGLGDRKDHTHFRKSLTQVEASLAKEQHKLILFNFQDLLSSTEPEIVLGRWSQDKRTCKKAVCLLVSGAKDVFGLRSRKDLVHFWDTL